MDVQGSQYHLLHGAEDWAHCLDVATEEPLGVRWRNEADGLPSAAHSALHFDPELDGLRLRRETPLFRRAGRLVPLEVSARRGAGRDSYGNWYWIGTDRTSIWWVPAG